MPPFPAQSTSYEPTIAWWLATCSSLTYYSKPEIIQQLESLGFCDVTFFEFLGTFGYIARHQGLPPDGPFAILVFRGTENDYTNILTDVEIIKRPVPDQNLRVHGGFLTALQEVWGTSSVLQQTGRIRAHSIGPEGVSNALEKLPHGLPLFFGGHSLGGALATLAALYHPPRALYTFGSPRVGGKDFCDKIQKSQIPTYRVVNSTDIIPRLPSALFGFRHVGTLVYFTRSGHMLYPWSVKNRVIAVLEAVRELPFLVTLILPSSLATYSLVKAIQPRLFTNHRIREYVNKLKAVVKL